METEFSQFTEIYNQYEAKASQHTELEAIKIILGHLQRWSQIIADVETALDSERLEYSHEELVQASEIIAELEKETRLIAILPKMRAKMDDLNRSVRLAFVNLWNEIVSIQIDEQIATLTVTNDVKGSRPDS